jgi:single-strand DNA-binding protein
MNISFISGRLTAKPFVASTKSGSQLVRFTIANNDQKATDTKSETAVFIDCVAFGKTGEAIAKWLDKGNPILLQGRLTNSTKETKDGLKIKETKIFVEKFEFIGNRDATNSMSKSFEKSSQSQTGVNYQTSEEEPF